MRYQLLYTAVLVLSNVKKDETFILNELFPPIVWKNLITTDKANLGADFIDWVTKIGNNIVKPLDKDEKGRQRYIKL